MIKEGLRLFAVILLIVIIIMDDFPFYTKMKDPGTQMFLALIILAMIFYDVTFGFIMGLVLMLIYYEIYKKIILQHEKEQYDSSVAAATNNSVTTTKIDFISESQLLQLQNNVWDVNNFNTEIKSIEGLGAQGLNMGYDSLDTYAIW